jgi:hypothetical protein
MSSALSVNIIYNKANTYGLNEDVIVIERALKKIQNILSYSFGKAKLVDMREAFTHCDIQIHLEIPVFSAISWAHTNILLVNPERWSYEYDAYVHAFDALIFRDCQSARNFELDFVRKGISADKLYVVPWSTSWQVKDIRGKYNTTGELGFVSFLAGSMNKYNYIKQILPYWQANDPPLTIYTTRNDFAEDLKKLENLASNITIKCQDLDEDNRQRIMVLYRGHLVCSEGEGFGYAGANAEVAGAFTIMNSLPVFMHYYRDMPGVHWLSNIYRDSEKERYSFASPSVNVREELDTIFREFKDCNFEDIRIERQESANDRFANTCNSFTIVFREIQKLVKERRPVKGVFHCPPVLNIDDCPPISIITPTYNRKKLIDIAFHNMLSTDYPHNKIEWIVIEDNEKTPHMVSEKIINFQIQVPDIKIKYIPIEGRMTIGEKRNHAIEHSSNDIILFMDDDDHYPVTSFRRRVAWLTKGVKCGKVGADIACCTTIALYDLLKGISAVNVPPFDIPFSQRISEATLTFKKSAWNERKFPNVSISEGEEWISGRENNVIEIPPQQIIVAFSHGDNQSSRRIPPSDTKPACFWGFPKEYLIFIHKLVDVEIEDDTKSSTTSNSRKMKK